ncbi:hypothetical protein LTR32_004480 [Rachicladosporium monterosium]|uniref:Uncharacterized protein n=1 Tax=Rachicladosporium monterosium TaxID=1507873 RepID=A0ABR0L4K1_9PEZI|nr:hypothetical protein LTR32_004480 [Rachicladosporium monterosium]
MDVFLSLHGAECPAGLMRDIWMSRSTAISYTIPPPREDGYFPKNTEAPHSATVQQRTPGSSAQPGASGG